MAEQNSVAYIRKKQTFDKIIDDIHLIALKDKTSKGAIGGRC